MTYFFGLDIGSVNSKIAVLDENTRIIVTNSLSTNCNPVAVSKRLLEGCSEYLSKDHFLVVTGSARSIVSQEIKADIMKNEITCQALAAEFFFPGVSTVIEIGGQDSKLILLKDGFIDNFSMNTVCAAGTGSFLDHQASRLGMTIEEFGMHGLASVNPEDINARCTVFAESDMIHSQQSGGEPADIIYGLCLALARNYLSDIGKIRGFKTPIAFLGGVANNPSMVKAFKEVLKSDLLIPGNPEMTGAIGAALIQIRHIKHNVNTYPPRNI